MMQIQTNDALGGGGSLPQQLQGVVVGGLSRLVDGYLSKKYPLTSFNDTATVTAKGDLQPRSVAAQEPTARDKAAEFLRSPAFLIGAAALVGVAVLALILRK